MQPLQKDESDLECCASKFPRRQLTDRPSDIGVQSRKDNGAVFERFWLALLHGQVKHDLGDGCRLLPLDSVFVGLAGRPRRRSKDRDFEVGVLCYENNEALADGAFCPPESL